MSSHARKILSQSGDLCFHKKNGLDIDIENKPTSFRIIKKSPLLLRSPLSERKSQFRKDFQKSIEFGQCLLKTNVTLKEECRMLVERAIAYEDQIKELNECNESLEDKLRNYKQLEMVKNIEKEKIVEEVHKLKELKNESKRTLESNIELRRLLKNEKEKCENFKSQNCITKEKLRIVENALRLSKQKMKDLQKENLKHESMHVVIKEAKREEEDVKHRLERKIEKLENEVAKERKTRNKYKCELDKVIEDNSNEINNLREKLNVLSFEKKESENKRNSKITTLKNLIRKLKAVIEKDKIMLDRVYSQLTKIKKKRDLKKLDVGTETKVHVTSIMTQTIINGNVNEKKKVLKSKKNSPKIKRKKVKSPKKLKKKLKKMLFNEFVFAKKKQGKLTKGNLNEIYSYSNPPDVVKEIVQCVLLLLGVSEEEVMDWGNARKFVKSNLLKSLKKYKPNRNKYFTRVRDYVRGVKKKKLFYTSQSALILFKWLQHVIDQIEKEEF